MGQKDAWVYPRLCAQESMGDSPSQIQCELSKMHRQTHTRQSLPHIWTVTTIYALYSVTCKSVSLIKIQCYIPVSLFLLLLPPSNVTSTPLSVCFLPVLDDCSSRLPVERRNQQISGESLLNPTPTLYLMRSCGVENIGENDCLGWKNPCEHLLKWTWRHMPHEKTVISFCTFSRIACCNFIQIHFIM